MDITLAASVVKVQEHDAAPVEHPNAVAPFSDGRAHGLLGTTLETGFTASRALYNVVRRPDLTAA